MDMYYEFDEMQDWADDPYEGVREALNPAYDDLSAQEVEWLLESVGLSAEDMEFNFKKALRSAGSFVKAAAPTLLPVAGTVVGTAFGGPAGGAIGSTLGQLAGGAIGGAGRPSTGTSGQPSTMTAGVPRPQQNAAGGSPAAAQILQLLNRPELLQSLLSMAMGQAGNRQTNVGSTSVPPAAFANLLGQLANQAAAEYNSALIWDSEDVPAYLLDGSGHLLVDPSLPEQRAARLLDLLDEASWWEATIGQAWDGHFEVDEYDTYLDELEIFDTDAWWDE